MANIKQVAAYAGLSPACVSKYLKNPKSVRADSKQRIEQAIRALNYTPSPIARSLRSRRTNCIMVIQRSIVTPFYHTLFDNIRLNLERHGYTAILQICDGSVPPPSAFLQVDGVIMVLQDKQNALQIYSKIPEDTPVVMYSPEKLITNVPTITIDLSATTLEMCRYLCSVGCRTFAYFGRSPYDIATKLRLAAFRSFFEDKPQCLKEEHVLLGTHSHGSDFQTGNKLAGQLVSQGNLPDAVFCENDLIAIGCATGLMYHGVIPSRDILVSGADNIPWIAEFEPKLITQEYDALPDLLCDELYNALKDQPTNDHELHPSIVDWRKSPQSK
jgi:DNA-binding LacI/PurR family transcriptional regulator